MTGLSSGRVAGIKRMKPRSVSHSSHNASPTEIAMAAATPAKSISWFMCGSFLRIQAALGRGFAPFTGTMCIAGTMVKAQKRKHLQVLLARESWLQLHSVEK